ncbi:DUF4097 family beta strand repeat-containing protein [Hymenobacter chitinivorans]|uniref:Adhesin n=1 Tax=Hymenobacter chitinivorans DSM 11115 TaxID=1121954 RepID=A0A2M9BPG3_9BACT|nr:DUF4097 family beta strand repeat-containing protein [Hymenobacter chitinivorans]PJJ59844.1 hypothetical protein CLV45_1266 [Hymenobacter chitinivorans DSM 11115]
MKKLLPLLWLCAASLTATAQTAPTFTSTCDEGKYYQSGQERYCETRDLVVAAPASGPLVVDGMRNGSISVKSWAGKDVRVRARVQAWGTDAAAAKAQAATVQVGAAANKLQATSTTTEEEQHWAVSYEIFVPEKLALDLKTHNGSISLLNVRGPVTFEAQNGSVTVSGSGGDVKGRTQNGSLNITLAGKKWEGKGLDLTTQNGSIRWKLPADYSAQFISRTVNGKVDTDFGNSVSGKIGRDIAVNLGKGGAPVKAVTTNGGITVRRAE